MRRTLFLICALLGSGCARTASMPQARVPHGALPPVAISVLGDSLAFGTGASDTSNGFAFDVYRAIARDRPGSEITNLAIGGSVAADVLRLQVARLHERRANVVVLCVGGNDIVRATDPAAFGRTYRELVTAIRRAAPRAALVAVGVPDVSISPLFRERPAIVRALAAADDRAARRAVRDAHGRYVDLFGLTRRADAETFLSDDRFHPSDRGHAAIARLTLPAVREALQNK